MQVHIKLRKSKPSIEFMDIQDGTWVASLDEENTDRLLINNKGDVCSVINLKDGTPEYLTEDDELFNLTKVKIVEIKLEEV